jgi:hypothetical protein
MKLVLSSFAIVLASSAFAATSQPAPIAAVQSPAPSLERVQLARRFVSTVLSPERYIETMRSQAESVIDCGCDDDEHEAAATNAAHKAEAEKDLTRFLGMIEPKIRERMPDLVEAYSQVYAREFSADELQQMVSFAETPAGRHYLTRRTQLDADKAVQMQQQGFWLDIMPAMQQFQREKCQERTAQRIAAGDKNAKCALANKDETAAG